MRVFKYTCSSDAVALCHNGLYKEILISNGTPLPIHAVDCNNKAELLPVDTYPIRHGYLVITVRHHIGSRASKDQRYYSGIPLQTIVIEIPQMEIERRSFYDVETNYLFSSSIIGSKVDHPFKMDILNDAVEKAMLSIKNAHSKFFISCVINDPKARAGNVFAYFAGATVPISVTNVKAPEATMNLVVNNGDVSYMTASLNIESLFTDGNFVHSETESLIALGLTADEAVTAHKKFQSAQEAAVVESVGKRMAAERDDFKTRYSALERKVKLLEDSKANEILEFKNKIATSELNQEKILMENRRVKAEAAEWKAIYEARVDQANASAKLHSEMERRVEQEYRTRKAEEASRAETINLIMTIGKALGGFLVGVLIPALINKKR